MLVYILLHHLYSECDSYNLHFFNYVTPSGSEKKLARSSVAHMIFITIGLFSSNTQAMIVLGMVNGLVSCRAAPRAAIPTPISEVPPGMQAPPPEQQQL